jgi:hypothetical protein
LIFICTACSDKGRFYSKEAENLPLEVKIERFDLDFMSMDSASIVEKYPTFYTIYVRNILEIPATEVPKFKADSTVRSLFTDVEQEYSSVEDVEKTLTKAFKYYKYYFPEREVPKVSFHVSGFNQCVVALQNRISASADYYLGKDYPMYSSVAYQYEVPYLTREHMPVDVMLGWLSSEFPTNDYRLLESMINHGKLMYMLEAFLLDYKMSEILSYSEEQFAWCEEHEKRIWHSIVENKELYSTDWRTIMKYTQPAPFTSGYSQEHSPGRLGVYMGWKIVSSFMKAHKELSLSDLMSTTDAQEIIRYYQDNRFL